MKTPLLFPLNHVGLTRRLPQGIPGRDGKDGTPGLDGEKVNSALCTTASGGFTLQTPTGANVACLCAKGEAGRHGVVGEKGPNGLPVGITSFNRFDWRTFKMEMRAAGLVSIFL